MATKMPVLFVGHGNPINAIEENDFSKAWIEEGRKLPHPRAILCVSAHWVTRGTLVTAMDKPRTIYDMYGFPPELYEVRYDAPGAPDLAEQVRRIIKATDVRDDFEWGLDHGTWSALRRMFPEANVPVVQMSLDAAIAPEKHLVIGSGNIVHNLRLARLEDSAYDWAVEFDQRVKNWIEQNDHDPIVHFERGDQAAALAINSAEHYVPLLYSLALRDESDTISFFADKVIGGSISMRSVKIG
ncbi:4,5-DOPA dioxygenase extradiol [Anaerolineae bacterium AMX1]|nr:4,5-DOPA dioxygenase extradiol [Anaerolineae bacterium AMX1]